MGGSYYPPLFSLEAVKKKGPYGSLIQPISLLIGVSSPILKQEQSHKTRKFQRSTKLGKGADRTGIWGVEGEMALPLSQTWQISGQSTTAVIACYIWHNIYLDIRDDVDVDPEHDEPDELLPLLGHVNSEG